MMAIYSDGDYVVEEETVGKDTQINSWSYNKKRKKCYFLGMMRGIGLFLCMVSIVLGLLY